MPKHSLRRLRAYWLNTSSHAAIAQAEYWRFHALAEAQLRQIAAEMLG